MVFLAIQLSPGPAIKRPWNIEIVTKRSAVGIYIQKSVASTVNSLWPSDAKRRHRSESTLTQVMTWCLTAQSHYLNQCCLTMNEVLRHSTEGSFTGNAQEIYSWCEFENYQFDITVAISMDQWVNVAMRLTVVSALFPGRQSMVRRPTSAGKPTWPTAVSC